MARDRHRDGADDTEMSTLNSPVSRLSSDGPPDHHLPDKPPEVKHDGYSTARTHVQKTALWTLLLPLAWTIIFTVVLLIAVKVYEDKRILTEAQKDTFNTITTGLILFLGLSFYEAYKNLAKAFRHRIEQWFDPGHQHSHLVEGFDSLMNVVQLSFARISLGFRIFCLVWLLVNLIAQVVAAVISLTYSLEDGKDYNGTYTRSGNVSVSNLTCYIHGGQNCALQVTADSLSHAYGDSTLAADSSRDTDCGYFDGLQGLLESKQNYKYYCQRNATVQQFGYRFKEYNKDDRQKSFPHFTKRTIIASSGKCNEYSQVGQPSKTIVGDDDGLNFISAANHSYTNGSINGTILIPTSALGLDGTTYIYRGKNPAPDERDMAFGDRGMWMWVYKNPASNPNSDDPLPAFYECPITVGAVSNVDNPAHNISDKVARQAAASIALQGQFKGVQPNQDFTQWQWYANGHPWEVHFHNNSRIGANIAEHAIVSLAEMVDRNPVIKIPGTVPFLGSQLSVKWRYFIPLLAAIVAADIITVAFTYWALRYSPYHQLD